jgi:hypothetical protein
MKRLVEFPFDQGGSVVVEVDESSGDPVTRGSVERANRPFITSVAAQANFTVSMTCRRAVLPVAEMKAGLAGRIFGEMDIDAAVGWMPRVDAAVSAPPLETISPQKAAVLLIRIESKDTQELLNYMRAERSFYVRKL